MGVETSRSNEPPLVLVYLGQEIPKYTDASLRFAARGHAGKTVLLTDSSHQLSGGSAYEVEDFQRWYDPSLFQTFRQNTTLDPHFRGGFWLHAVERFFVLRQFMDKQGLTRLFHAELDVMVFDIDGVSHFCDRRGSGVFAVAESPGRALASLFYVNSKKKFDHLLTYVCSNAGARNEMEILGAYCRDFPANGHLLPSHQVLDKAMEARSSEAWDDKLGLFDANAFGQWLFGLDPRNVRSTVKNHFRHPTVSFAINRLRFSLPVLGRLLIVEGPDRRRWQLRTLHIHSKIVGRLDFRPVLLFYLWANRLPFRLTILRKRGWVEARLLESLLRGRVFSVVRTLHGILPRLSEIALLRAAARSATPLSKRQRVLLVSLLPEARSLAVVHSDDSRRISGGLPIGDRRSSWPPRVSPEIILFGESALAVPDVVMELSQSSSEAVLVRIPEAVWAAELALPKTDVQLLIVSPEKYDDEWPLVLSRWGPNLNHSLSFSGAAQIIRPAWVREMFPGGSDDILSWHESLKVNPWLAFVQAYGAWARTHHSNRVILCREPANS